MTEHETCEDRGYRCCDAFPPDDPDAPDDGYYDEHLRRWRALVAARPTPYSIAVWGGHSQRFDASIQVDGYDLLNVSTGYRPDDPETRAAWQALYDEHHQRILDLIADAFGQPHDRDRDQQRVPMWVHVSRPRDEVDGPTYGPYSYVEMLYDSVRVSPDGDTLLMLLDGEWRETVTSEPGPTGWTSTTPDPSGDAWSDVTIYAGAADSEAARRADWVAQDRCAHCGAALSARFGFSCCDDCADRLARECEAEDAAPRAASDYSSGPYVALRVFEEPPEGWVIDAVDADGGYSEAIWTIYDGVPMSRDEAIGHAPEFAAEYAPGVTEIRVIPDA